MSSAHGVRWVNQYGFISFPRPWDRSHSLAWKPTAKESAAWNFAGWRPSPCGRSSPGRSSTAKAGCTRPLPSTSRPALENPLPHFRRLLAKSDPVARTARECKGLPDLLLERPKAVMWPNRGGGRRWPYSKSSHCVSTVRRLCLPQVLTEPKITESRLTKAQTHPRKNSKSEISIRANANPARQS